MLERPQPASAPSELVTPSTASASGERSVGDDGLLPADKDPEAEVVAFRALELLGVAEPARMGQRDTLEEYRIGGVGAGTASAGDKILQEVERGPRFVVRFDHRTSGHFQMGLPDPGSP